MLFVGAQQVFAESAADTPPIGVTLCRVVVGSGSTSNLLCRFLYILIVNQLPTQPAPPPMPTPIPTPTPTLLPAFWLSSVATEIMRTDRECHFDIQQLAMICLVEGQFPDITPDNCPHRVRVAVSFDDGFNPVMDVIPEQILSFDSKGIRMEFFPVAVDTGENNAYNPEFFTAWVQCE